MLRPAQIIRSVTGLSAWQVVLRTFLTFVADTRPCFAITEEPRGWSVGHELGRGRTWTVDGKPYLSVFFSTIKSPHLDKIAASEDFERGFLWFLFKGKGQEATMRDLLADARAARRNNQRLKNVELLRLTGDGQIVEWQNPGKDAAAIDRIADQIAKDAGWEVNAI